MKKNPIKNICVFCGASTGNHPIYEEQAKKLGQLIAEKERRLVYGGGNRGLMGTIANAVLEAGGEVFGVIPEKLVEAETAHTGLTHLEIVPDMHTRKFRMSELADGFIAMPGGLGTLEELFEIWTWSQIGYHSKPIGLFDVNNFYTQLTSFLHHIAEEGFVRSSYLATLLNSPDPEVLLQQLDAYEPHNLNRWSK